MTCAQSRASRRGVALVMMLVLLAVMGMAATLASRLALSGELSAQGRYAHHQAMLSAELALAYCEAQIGLPDAAWPADANPDAGFPARWQVLANWTSGTSAVMRVPPVAAWGRGGSAVADQTPQCMVEALPLRRARGADDRLAAWLVTARGFSPGRLPGGRPAEVWLQSVVQK